MLPRLTCTTSQHPRHCPGFGLGQLTDKSTGFVRPTASHLGGQHHQPRATLSPREFRVRALLASAGFGEGCPVYASTLRARSTVCLHRRNQRGIDGQLGSAEQRKPVRNDLQTTGVMVSNGKVQIPDEEIGGDPSSGFTTNLSGSTLQGEPPTPQDSRSRTRCTVVAKDVEWTATPAGARREREGKPEATKKQDAEDLRSEPSGAKREQKRRATPTWDPIARGGLVQSWKDAATRHRSCNVAPRPELRRTATHEWAPRDPPHQGSVDEGALLQVQTPNLDSRTQSWQAGDGLPLLLRCGLRQLAGN